MIRRGWIGFIVTVSALIAFLLLAPGAFAQDTPTANELNEDDAAPPEAIVDPELTAAAEDAEDAVIVETAAQDAAITARLESIFANIEALDGVSVTSRSGVVRLEGEVASTAAREQAEDIAGELDGVIYVDSQLVETGAVGERLEPAIERLDEWRQRLIANLPMLAIALILIALFWLFSRLLLRWDGPFRFLSSKRLVRGIIQQVVATFVLLIGVLLALQLLDLTAVVGAVFGAAGIVGIAIGFAFRDIVENYLASVLLSSRRPFEVGDFVRVDTHEGKVMRLTTRDTVLMTVEGNHLRLPNALVYKGVITNFTRNPLRLFSFVVGVGTSIDLTLAATVGVDTLRQTPGVLADPGPFVRIDALADSTVNIKLFAWVDQREADWTKVKSEAMRLVKEAFDAHGVAMPAPEYRIDLLGRDLSKPAADRDEGMTPSPERTIAPVTPPPPPPATPSEEVVGDVEPDDVLERQIELDQASSDEENLLEEEENGERRDGSKR
ncbi:MAG: mechanosensitive ion channel domain-containing protein [Phycisphaerales bacterium]